VRTLKSSRMTGSVRGVQSKDVNGRIGLRSSVATAAIASRMAR
jgi:hypothetical protein